MMNFKAINLDGQLVEQGRLTKLHVFRGIEKITVEEAVAAEPVEAEEALAEGEIEIREGETLAEIKERIRKDQQIVFVLCYIKMKKYPNYFHDIQRQYITLYSMKFILLLILYYKEVQRFILEILFHYFFLFLLHFFLHQLMERHFNYFKIV
jgi:hypothetical protein